MDNPSFYPLTSAQRDLWINHKMFPDLPIHSMCTYCRLSGALDLDAFREAIRFVVGEHDSLRLRFEQRDGDIVQAPGPVPEQVVQVIDLSNRADPETEARQWIDKEFERPLDLYEYPLFRFALLKCSDDCWYWVIRVHHIINDGWGISQFMQQVRSRYKGIIAKEAVIENSFPSFLETIERERGYLASDRCKQDKQYWRSRLHQHAGYAIYRGSDQRKQGLASIRRNVQTFDPQLLERVYQFAARHNVTVTNVLLGLIYLIARRRTGSDDQIIGIPNLGRTGRKQKSMLGMFVNMQPFRFSPEDTGQTFVDLIREIKRRQLQDYRAHRLPYREMYETSEVAGTDNDLFEMIFSHQKQDYNPDFGTAGGVFEVSRYGVLQAPLSIYLCEFGDHQPLKLDIAYHSRMYSEIEIENISRQILGLMQRLDKIADQHPSEIEILTNEERELNLQFVRNRKEFLNRGTITDHFSKTVRRYPDKTAVRYSGHRLSYEELDACSDAVAKYLVQQGFACDRIAVMVNRNEHLPALLLGILKAGGTYVPIDPRYPQQRIEFMLEDAEIKGIIADPSFNPVFEGTDRPLIDASKMLRRDLSETTLPDIDPSDTAYIIYTSGSSGRPKGVQVSHENVCRLFAGTHSLFDFQPSDVWTLFHSYAFDFSVWELFGPLFTGGEVVVVPEEISRNPASFADLLLDKGVTILNQTPSAFQYLAPELLKHNTVGELRYVVFGGEQLSFQQLRTWESVFGTDNPALVNMYGITETTVHVTWHRVTGEEIRSDHPPSLIGKPLPDLDIVLLNDQQELAPIGQAGEMYIGGRGVSKGYLNRPDLNTEKFVPHPWRDGERMYRSGDMARLRTDGRLEFIGRRDRQVQVRGFRVETGEIEHALLRHSSITKATVMPYQSDETELIAYIFLNGQNGLSQQGIRTHLAEYLPDYMVPAHIFLMSHWPLTVNGKLDKAALPSPADHVSVSTNGTGSRLIRQIQTIWQGVLGIGAFNPATNFFDLGGNSLSMIKVQKRLHEELGTEVELIDLYRYPTAQKLAAYVSEKNSGRHGSDSINTNGRQRQRGTIAANMRNKRNSNF